MAWGLRQQADGSLHDTSAGFALIRRQVRDTVAHRGVRVAAISPPGLSW